MTESDQHILWFPTSCFFAAGLSVAVLTLLSGYALPSRRVFAEWNFAALLSSWSGARGCPFHRHNSLESLTHQLQSVNPGVTWQCGVQGEVSRYNYRPQHGRALARHQKAPVPVAFQMPQGYSCGLLEFDSGNHSRKASALFF